MDCRYKKPFRIIDKLEEGDKYVKILIAEDDIPSMIFLKSLAARFGECTAVADGLRTTEEYYQAAYSNAPYELVFLDIMLPKMDGLQTLTAIREFEEEMMVKNGHKARIIMVTALNDELTVEQARQAGCDAYICKPVNRECLETILKEFGILPGNSLKKNRL